MGFCVGGYIFARVFATVGYMFTACLRTIATNGTSSLVVIAVTYHMAYLHLKQFCSGGYIELSHLSHDSFVFNV